MTQESHTVTVGGLVSNPGDIVLQENMRTLGDIISIAAVNGSTVTQSVANPTNTRVIDIGEKMISDTSDLLEVAKRIVEVTAIGTELDPQNPQTPDEKLLDELYVRFTNAKGQFTGLRNGTFTSDFNGAVLGVVGTETPPGSGQSTAYTGFIKGVSEERYLELEAGVRHFQRIVNGLVASYRGEFAAVTNATVSAGNLLVNLKRAGKSYYFPVPFVQAGIAGDIELHNSDVITVERGGDTVLASTIALGGNQILLKGLVRQPGLHPPGKRVVQIVTDNLEGTNVKLEQVCVVLERAGQVFVLPYDSVIERDSPFSTVLTIASDRVTLLPYFQAPLLDETVIGSSIRNSLASRVDLIVANRPVLDHHEEKHVRLQKTFRSAGSKLGNWLHP